MEEYMLLINTLKKHVDNHSEMRNTKPSKKQIAKEIKYIIMLIQELVFKLLGRQLLAVCVHRLNL